MLSMTVSLVPDYNGQSESSVLSCVSLPQTYT